MRFVILTDTHFVPAGCKLYGLDPAARIAVAVRAINRDHRDIAFVIVTGDLAHRGERAAYESLKHALGELKAPVILMMGNHDRRASFRAAFPDADDDGDGFVQSIRHFEAATVITLDTLDEDRATHAGWLCQKRLSFLENALRGAPAARPILLFQHHPPFDTGLPHMDRFKLRQSEEEWDAIARTRSPTFLFMGHLHRPVGGVWRGIPFHIQRAVNHQVAFDLITDRHIPGTHEAPDYSLVTVDGGDIVIHQCSFLYDGPVYSLDDASAQAALSPAELARCGTGRW